MNIKYLGKLKEKQMQIIQRGFMPDGRELQIGILKESIQVQIFRGDWIGVCDVYVVPIMDLSIELIRQIVNLEEEIKKGAQK